MPTGACGINCDVCGLHLSGICSSCGHGMSLEAEKKSEIQKKLFGQPCPILACARMNRIQYCMKDCQSFPCDNFSNGPYPFSKGYLNMQERRRKEDEVPVRDTISVPREFWDQLAEKDLQEISENTLAETYLPNGLVLRFLNEVLYIDIQNRCIWRHRDKNWARADNRLLVLIVLVYLLNATPFHLKEELISVKDLKDAHFFQGPHAIDLDPLLARFGDDPEGLLKSAENLGGKPLYQGDVAVALYPFPKIPVNYILWVGDEEFAPNMSVLFDRSIERHLSADAIWGLVTLVSQALLNSPV